MAQTMIKAINIQIIQLIPTKPKTHHNYTNPKHKLNTKFYSSIQFTHVLDKLKSFSHKKKKKKKRIYRMKILEQNKYTNTKNTQSSTKSTKSDFQIRKSCY